VLSRNYVVCLCLVLLAMISVASEPPGVVVDVPFVAQEKNACGAASVSMLMNYWARQQGKAQQADAAAIQLQLYSEKAKGIFASDLKRYLEAHGFRTFVFRGGWEDLKTHLAKGRPLIVALGDSGTDSPLHYVVVTGLDWNQRLVFLNDPADRKSRMADWREFERGWAVTDHWTLLAVPN